MFSLTTASAVVIAFCIAMTRAQVINLNCYGDLHMQVRNAPVGAELVGSTGCTFTLSRAVKIMKPLRIRNFRAQLRPGLGNTAAIVISSRGVQLIDFELIGNKHTVSFEDRESLLRINAGGFSIVSGAFVNSSRDGITVVPARSTRTAINAGSIRNIYGYGVERDVVAINSRHGLVTSKIYISGVEVYDSAQKGAVEVADGCQWIHVQDVFCERCFYVVSIQDHIPRWAEDDPESQMQANHHIRFYNIRGRDLMYGVISETSPIGHSDIIFSSLAFSDCRQAVYLRYLNSVSVRFLRIERPKTGSPLVLAEACNRVSLSNAVFRNSTHRGIAIATNDCTELYVGSVVLERDTQFWAGLRVEVAPSFIGIPVTAAYNRFDAARNGEIIQRFSG
ncbi:hypothetical protein NDN08_005013 [Rhodosorus marinus]|uniref:Altered inheritance of mitochondria protein 24, mitochondrial n=1 Tax=Rhodosorus marinus TaxID=101924 RepID=A0AAV8UI05_9RHOD|nr:hypothetical protein NDN08_005013 [Rhodosorus marinus]